MSEQSSMNESSWADTSLRRFLLGEFDEQERQQVESRFLTDESFKTRLLSIEEALIDDYLYDSLPDADRTKFIAQYAKVPEQARKLRIAQTIKDYAARKSNATALHPEAKRKWFDRLNFRPVILIPIATVLVIAVLLTIVWFRRGERPIQQTVFERELIALNTNPNPNQTGQQIQSISLPPVSLRSADERAEVLIRDDARILELQLIWTRKERPLTYVVNLKRVGTPESFTIRVDNRENLAKPFVTLKIPAQLVTAGLYQINVIVDTGVGEEYQVTLRRKAS